MQNNGKGRGGTLKLAGAAGQRLRVSKDSWITRLRGTRRSALESGQPALLTQVFDQLAHLGRHVADEGQRVLSASMEIARESKANSDQLRASMPLIDEIRDRARDAATLCADSQTHVAGARRLMEECLSLSQKRTSLIKDLVASIERSHGAFDEVNGNVTEVERFLEVIQEIGAQTSLLALNAAIEAARAGQHGSGFLVVAREMRLLADKTQAATEQIRQITDRVQTATRSAGSVLDAALRASSLSSEQGKRVREALDGMTSPMDQAEVNLARVAEAAGRQLDVLIEMDAQWHAMRQSAGRSTHNADASAEMSMHTINLAVRFYNGLTQLAEVLQAAPALVDGGSAWRERAAALTDETARCAAAFGLTRLEETRPQLEAGLRELKLECKSRGLCSRRGMLHTGDALPELCLGGRAVNNSTELVDAVLRRTGLNTTLFVLASEEDDGALVFYRVATTVKRSDGSRAARTSLNPLGNVADKLLAGEQVYGYAYILGVPHIAVYEPIKDAVGEVIGAWYVGLAMTDASAGHSALRV